MTRSNRRTLTVSVAVVAAFLAGVLLVTSASSIPGLNRLLGSAEAQQVAPRTAETVRAQELGDAFSNVAEAVGPTVVQIRSARFIERDDPTAQGGGNPFEGTPFEDFFRGGPGGPQEQRGLGSGVIVRPDGYIVTNNHVIQDADELEVFLSDGSVYDATVVGADPSSDLAVLKVDVDGLAYLGYGASDDIRVGQWVLAFGSPLDASLGNTVTSGIISATGRTQAVSAEAFINDFIQTDAAINPGNSGGPLVNLRGEIVGINTAIYSRTGGFQGISFAIPVDIVENTVEQIIENGAVERGYLGVGPQRVSAALAEALGVPRGAAQIASVDPESAAAEAGIEPGDVLISIEGRQLRSPSDIYALIGNNRPGDEIEMELADTSGDRRTVEVRLGRRPDQQVAQNAPPAPDAVTTPPQQNELTMDDLGLTLQNLTPALREQYSVPADVQGVFVADVDRRSDAFRTADLQPGLVISEIDRQPVTDVASFRRAYEAVSTGDTFLLRVRAGVNQFITALTKP